MMALRRFWHADAGFTLLLDRSGCRAVGNAEEEEEEETRMQAHDGQRGERREVRSLNTYGGGQKFCTAWMTTI